LDFFEFEANVLGPIIGLSQLNQNSSFLISYLFERPDVLVKAVNICEKRPIYNRLVFYIIPMLFGFYSSQELLSYSEVFYYNAIESCSKAVFSDLICAIFWSPSSHRFFEATFLCTFNEMFQYINVHPKADNNDVQSYYFNVLIERILKCTCLLPKEHLTIIRFMKMKGWDDQEIWKVVYNKCFLHMAICIGKTFHFKSRNIVLVSILKQLSQAMDPILVTILRSNSVYKIPSTGYGQDRDCIQLQLYLQDMIELSGILDKAKLLPSGSYSSEFNSISQQFHNYFYWVTIYKKSKKFFDKIIIFGEVFDKYSRDVLTLSEISDWNSLTQDSTLVFSQNVIRKHIIKNVSTKKELKRAASSLFKLFSFPKIRIFMYISTISVFIQSFNLDHEIIFNKIDIEWRRIVKRCKILEMEPDFLGFCNSLCSSSCKVLLEAIKLLSYSENCTYYQKHSLIVKAFEITRTLEFENGKVVYFYLLHQSNSPSLLSDFVVLQSLGYLSNVFRSLLSNYDLIIWNMFESAVSYIISDDRMFSTAVSDCCMFLSEMYYE